MVVFRLMRAFLRFWLRVFFRRIQVVGGEHVPADGAVIFCGNHPNSLLDPALIIAFCGRTVRFAAKDVLFRSRFLRIFLDALGAVPIRRRKDHGGGAVDNSSAFDALFSTLAEGGTMGIFPEGISHDAAHLSKLKTGAARIALGTVDKHDVPVKMVPCGLHYVHPKRFRSSVLVQFGEPITVGADRMEQFAEDDRAASTELTDELTTRMRGLTVNAEDWESVRVLDAVRRLYQPRDIALEDRVELSRRFNQVYPTVQSEPEVRQLYNRVRDYQDRLEVLGVTDRALTADTKLVDIARHVIRHLLLMLVWLPLAGVGLVVHLPLIIAVSVTGPRLAPRKDVIATTKFVAGFIGIGVVYALAVAAAWWWAGPWAALATVGVLPLTGHASLRVLERSRALGSGAKTLSRLVLMRREVSELRAQRDALEQDVVAAVQRFKPEDMVALFPREVDEAGAS